MKKKITHKELKKIFKREIYFFMDYFSLKNFEIIFEDSDDKDIRASTLADEQNKIVIFNISTNWANELGNGEEEIKRVAFHEVMEVLFAPIRDKMSAFYSFEITDEIIHSKIVLFENVVLPLIK